MRRAAVTPGLPLHAPNTNHPGEGGRADLDAEPGLRAAEGRTLSPSSNPAFVPHDG